MAALPRDDGLPDTPESPSDLPGPPSGIDPSGELRGLAADCVHCGFCLPACPTYQLWGEEMDSPRGRIHLITQILDGTQASDDAAARLDRCLGCMACVPACPSGVRYDRLIEAARSWAEEPPAGITPVPPRSLRERVVRAVIFGTFPFPRRLRLLTGPLRLAQQTGLNQLIERSRLVGRFAPELAAVLRVAPASSERGRTHRHARQVPRTLPMQGAKRTAPAPGPVPGSGVAAASVPARAAGRIPALGPPRAVVGLLTGCVQQVFFPGVNDATARVLAAEGCDVIVPRGQGCCGALSLHTGRAAEAARFARRTIAAFEDAGVDIIVVNSAGCGSAMKEYGQLLRNAREGTQSGRVTGGWAGRAAQAGDKVRDFSEFLAELADGSGGARAVRHPLPVKAMYHEACHLGNAQGIQQQPRRLLRDIPGLELVEVGDGGVCCGSAGVYNLVQPEAARELGARKASAILATDAALVISANPGCSLQIARAIADTGTGTAPAVVHTAEVLDASLRGLTVSELTSR